MDDSSESGHGAGSPQIEEVVFGEPQRLATYIIETGELAWPGDSAPVGGVDDRALILACASDRVENYVLGQALDSSAHLELPTLDPDDDRTISIDVYFLIGSPPLVFLAGSGAAPRDVIHEIISEIAGDLSREDDDVATWKDLARGCEWLLVRFLRQRIRGIEASVRDALEDDSVSESDYTALREYPRRLAQVERLAAETPDPTWESHRPAPLYGRLAIGTPIIANPAQEAREASARLSGLISSQAVVLAQRQARDTERFQRLVTVVGATVLVPGLVAAIFGANVGFTGEGTTHGFWAMVTLMASSGLGSYAFLRSWELGVWSRLAKSGRVRWLRLESPHRRLAAAAAAAGVGFIAGVLLLVAG